MSPEQISILHTVSLILDKIGAWPIGTIFLVSILGPWIFMFIISRGYEKRFEAVTQMYEANVDLVKSYKSMAENLQEVVIYNTQSMQEVKDIAKNNLFCPLVKKQTKQTEVSG